MSPARTGGGRSPRRPPFAIAGHEVAAGRRARLELPIARLMSGTPVALPLLVLHGRRDGPALWVNAAIHGDEICGVEIIRRVLARLDPSSLRGTLVAVPIVNVHGFNRGERYLPDRRDLNRSFPGSARGSLASRIANLMMSEVVARCAAGIDLHTGSDLRTNLPQLRADLDQPGVLEMAEAFGPPLVLHSRGREGSLRRAATKEGATVLVFEGGETDRFDEPAIRVGADGVLRVLAARGMLDDAPPITAPSRISRRSKWARASCSGILHLDAALGDEVAAGAPLATIYDAFGKRRGTVRARVGGLVAGQTQRALVNRGDAILHIAELGSEGRER